jgi:putative FmdB family regulatory protein
MPTYSYQCKECGKTFDAFHSMMCTDPQHCPECGGTGKKLMSASSVIFKGSGFYSTDYRDSGYLEAQKKDSQSSTSPAKKDEPKKESPKTDDSSPSKESSSSKKSSGVAQAA